MDPLNKPGGRKGACAFFQNSSLFVLGGQDEAGALWSTVWKYEPASGNWAWWAGSALANANGTYGTLYQESSLNQPGARTQASLALDSQQGFVYWFGGYGIDANGSPGNRDGEDLGSYLSLPLSSFPFLGYLQDLWRWNLTSHQWSWLGGNQTVAGSDSTYGQLNVEGASVAPSGRGDAILAVMSARSQLFMAFGGNAGMHENGYCSYLIK